MQLFNEKVAAKRLAVSVHTLRGWRAQRRGPFYRKMGRSVRYEESDLAAFLESRKVQTEEHG